MKNKLLLSRHTNGLNLTEEQLERWVGAVVAEFREKRVPWCRVIVHPEDDKFVVVEGWLRKPKNKIKPKFVVY